ncbi:MAG TPA: PepSY domain-containing protein [Micropepsaceae bacterium]|nr:PepSY domain-containing protein [Micropepsaceae bacterium]
MTRFLWRATVITHRYLGVVVGLLMLVWFASGIVMMYVPYPGLTAKERLIPLGPIAWQTCCSLGAQNLSDDEPIRAAQIQSLAGEPVLYVRPDGRPQRISSLGPSGPTLDIDETKARAVVAEAAPRIIGAAARPVSMEVIERDQWTVGDGGDGNRPLYHFIFDDPAGTHIYVSSTTGEVVVWTTAAQRFGNWFGAVPHWLYFTQLRKDGPLWAQMVIWTSIIGAFLTVLGLYLGIAQLKRRNSGRWSPYRGWFYWHHITGLVFGVVTLTWVVSGTLSMNPWGFLEGRGGDERVRIAGEPLTWRTIRSSIAALKDNPPMGAVRIASAPLDGALFWLAFGRDGAVSRLDSEGRPTPLDMSALKAVAQRLARGSSIESQELITGEDAYYFDFSIAERSDAPPLPAYRVLLNDAEHTRYYLSPETGQLLRKVDADARGQRWLFSGLHRLDFAQWLRVRPVWDIVMLLLLTGALAGTATGVYLALLRIKRDLTFTRPR